MAVEAGTGRRSRPERLVFLDECGVLTNMARAPRPQPARRAGPRHGALRPLGAADRPGRARGRGIVAAMGIAAATDGAVFHAYLERVLLPELRRTKPDAVLVMDNLARPQGRARCASCSTLGLRLPLPAAPTRRTSTRSSPPGPR